MRRLHGTGEQRADPLLRHAGRFTQRQIHHHALGHRQCRQAAQGAGCLHRGAGAAMRLLPQRLDHDHGGAAREESAPERHADPRGADRPQVPLRHPCQHSARRQARGSGLREVAMTIHLNRRQALAGAGALVVSVALPGVKANAAIATQASRLALKPEQLATYISINQDGSAVGWVGKVDMGQGTEIGWLMMIAEELDLPPARVSMVQGHTDLTVDQGGASGSTGIWRAGAALRNAAAEARRVLVEMASEKLNVPADRLAVTDGIVSDKSEAARRVSYGDLIGGRHFDVTMEWNKHFGNELLVTGKAKPKSPSEYKTVGKPGTRRRDVAPKVMGTLEYIVDVKVPGMVHGRMIRPPVAGARPVAVDESSVKDIPGVQVVWQKGFIGLVAPKEWDAIRAARALKVTWSDVKPPFPDQKNLFDHIRNAPVMQRDDEENVGDVDKAFANAARIVEATYEWPFHSHACMGPACGIADMRDGEGTIWTGGQKPHHCREGIAIMFNMPEEKIKVVAMTGPGSYGRNDSGDATMDAAVLSKAVGEPVRVQYMRHDGHGWDPKAPATIHKARAAIDKDGKVTAWHYETKGFSRREFFRDEGSPERTLAGQLLDWPTARSRVALALRAFPRSDGAANPFRRRIVHGRIGACHQHGSGGIPSTLPQAPARHRRRQDGGGKSRMEAPCRRR